MYVCMYACVRVLMYACMYACMYVCIYESMNVRLHSCIHSCMLVLRTMCILWEYVRVHACRMSMCVYVYVIKFHILENVF